MHFSRECIAAVEYKRGSLTSPNAFRLMHLLEFFLPCVYVVCAYSWIRLVSLPFEGEMDVDGPDLSFACSAMHGTQVERALVNSRCVRAICLCARCNLLLKHPWRSH